MATVYAAEQLSLKRRLALKVLPFVTVLEPRQLQRFKNEARAAAALRLLHIVQLFAFGCERGVDYYAMEYIEGQTVAQAVADLAQPKNSQEPTAVAENPTQRSQLASRDKGDSAGEGNTDAPSFQRMATHPRFQAVEAPTASKMAGQCRTVYNDRGVRSRSVR